MAQNKAWDYFNKEEFACKCGKCENKISYSLINKLDVARSIAGTPFAISSGFRCIDHNKAVGGVSSSAHVSGLAADILTKDSGSRFKILKALISVGFNRIGISEGFIHADIDQSKSSEVAWDYY